MSKDSANVDVLLGIFHPGSYLSTQLTSLKNQIDVNVNLIVSFDSDVENSVREQIQSTFKKVVILEGPRQGPLHNYIRMLDFSTSEYTAFCDQDDIWEPSHLKDSLARLKKTPDFPALSFSSCNEFGEGRPRIWPKKVKVQTSSFIFENPARGCTMVMNKHSRDLLRSFPTDNIIMHDWLALLAVQLCGTVYFGDRPEVNYRIHSNNTIGRPRKIKPIQWLRMITSKHHPALEQYLSIYSHLRIKGAVSDTEATKIANKFESKMCTRYYINQRVRMNFLEDMLMKSYLIYFGILSLALDRNKNEYL